MKKFLFSGVVLLLSCFVSLGEVTRDIPAYKYHVKEYEVEIGLPEPFKAIHITDSHIMKIDKRDFERLGKRFNKRISKGKFIYHEIPLMDFIHYAEEHDDMLLLHTGDFIDMYSEAGLDYAAMIFKRLKNVIYCLGNHEFINVNGKAKLTEEAKSLLYESLQTAFPNDIRFYSRIYKGVNFVAIDNINSQISQDTFDRMKEEVKKGYPIVLLCHIPFYIPETIQKRLDERRHWKQGASGSVVGAPLEITEKYPGDDEKQTGPRYGQRSTELTLEFTEWLRAQTCLKAILCGHNHKRHVEQFSPSCVQITGSSCYNGNANIVTFK